MTIEQQTGASLEARCEDIEVKWVEMTDAQRQRWPWVGVLLRYVNELRRPVEAKEIRHIRERHEGIDSQCLGPEEMELWEHVGRLLKALAESQRILKQWIEAPPAQMSGPLGLQPVNSEGMRLYVDALVESQRLLQESQRECARLQAELKQTNERLDYAVCAIDRVRRTRDGFQLRIAELEGQRDSFRDMAHQFQSRPSISEQIEELQAEIERQMGPSIVGPYGQQVSTLQDFYDHLARSSAPEGPSVVGGAGIEPTTPCMSSKCSTAELTAPPDSCPGFCRLEKEVSPGVLVDSGLPQCNDCVYERANHVAAETKNPK